MQKISPKTMDLLPIMYLRDKFNFIIVLSILCLALEVPASPYRDPFVPLYVTNPLTEYERKLQRKMNVNQKQGLYPEMYVCKEGYADKNAVGIVKSRPFVVFDGEVFYKNDVYKNGVITDINCEYIRIVSGETEIRVSLYDEGMVEKVEESETNEAN